MGDNGWVKLHRKLLDNPIFLKEDLLQLFIYCLLKANHEPTKMIFNGKEITIERGQFITGRNVLSVELKKKPTATYNRLQILKNVGILDIKSNNKFSLVTLANYGVYQSVDEKSDSKTDNKVTTRRQQGDTNKNDKNDKNDKKKDMYAELVTMTAAEYQKLVDSYGEPATKKMIEILDNYKGANGRKYASDYKAILTWVVGRYQEDLRKSGQSLQQKRNTPHIPFKFADEI